MPDTFNFPYHKTRTEYPATSNAIQFGQSYTFATKPVGPPQRTFILSFKGMKWYMNGSSIDLSTNPTRNMGAIDAFYQAHELYSVFIYPHPIYGNVNVRFAEPLKHPDVEEGGTGVTNGFEIKLIEDRS